MANISDLERFSDEGLELIQKLLFTETKEDIILGISKIKKERKEQKEISLNDRFLVDQLNIDPDYIERLKQHGIFTMTQLLEADLDNFSSKGSEARKQYEYARVMFDFRPQEELQRKLGRPLKQSELAESIVKQVNEGVNVKRK